MIPFPTEAGKQVDPSDTKEPVRLRCTGVMATWHHGNVLHGWNQKKVLHGNAVLFSAFHPGGRKAAIAAPKSGLADSQSE
jgi:hypothetical protein